MDSIALPDVICRLDSIVRAAAAWRQAERLADEARAKAADIHQGIEPGNIKDAHRATQVAELAARLARDAYDRVVAEDPDHA